MIKKSGFFMLERLIFLTLVMFSPGVIAGTITSEHTILKDFSYDLVLDCNATVVTDELGQNDLPTDKFGRFTFVYNESVRQRSGEFAESANGRVCLKPIIIDEQTKSEVCFAGHTDIGPQNSQGVQHRQAFRQTFLNSSSESGCISFYRIPAEMAYINGNLIGDSKDMEFEVCKKQGENAYQGTAKYQNVGSATFSVTCQELQPVEKCRCTGENSLGQHKTPFTKYGIYLYRKFDPVTSWPFRWDHTSSTAGTILKEYYDYDSLGATGMNGVERMEHAQEALRQGTQECREDLDAFIAAGKCVLQ